MKLSPVAPPVAQVVTQMMQNREQIITSGHSTGHVEHVQVIGSHSSPFQDPLQQLVHRKSEGDMFVGRTPRDVEKSKSHSRKNSASQKKLSQKKRHSSKPSSGPERPVSSLGFNKGSLELAIDPQKLNRAPANEGDGVSKIETHVNPIIGKPLHSIQELPLTVSSKSDSDKLPEPENPLRIRVYQATESSIQMLSSPIISATSSRSSSGMSPAGSSDRSNLISPTLTVTSVKSASVTPLSGSLTVPSGDPFLSPISKTTQGTITVPALSLTHGEHQLESLLPGAVDQT